MTRVQRRRAVNALALVLSSLAAVVGLFFLLCLLVVIFQKGGAAINWAFLTDLPTPPGVPGGGMANAITGTLIITLLATLGGVPLGLLAGIYLSEFGRGERLGKVIRFLADTFMSAPSIVIGIFVYAILVVPMGGFSGLAGGVSLALIMLPVVTRTSEEMLKLVPQEMREASLALGAPYWHMVLHVALRGAKVGLITGVLLAVARVSGETAPLLFTTLNSPYWPSGLTDPMANLTVTIFNYAMSPYEDWQTQAWGAALLLATGVLGLNITARLLFRDRRRTS